MAQCKLNAAYQNSKKPNKRFITEATTVRFTASLME